MFKTAADLVRAALDLLELAKNEAAAGRSKRSGSIELAAAMMANHVFDWHHEHHVRSAGTPEGRAFASTFPDSDVLRRIANGTKHPRNPKHPGWTATPASPRTLIFGMRITASRRCWSRLIIRRRPRTSRERSAPSRARIWPIFLAPSACGSGQSLTPSGRGAAVERSRQQQAAQVEAAREKMVSDLIKDATLA